MSQNIGLSRTFNVNLLINHFINIRILELDVQYIFT